MVSPTPTRCDIAIIGAGMSGLAAGIRLAHFGRKVCIFERHDRVGGLNSYYTRNGRAYDVGLHAVTNMAAPDQRRAPLNKLLRQLRIDRSSLDFRPQKGSAIEFPGTHLDFNNDPKTMREGIGDIFPSQADGFDNLVRAIYDADAYALTEDSTSARSVLNKYLSDPQLADMLMCPVLYYGGAAEHDMPFQQFSVLFRSIFLEGLGRPSGGIRPLLDALQGRYEETGGELRLNAGVEKIICLDGGARALRLDDGSRVEVGSVLSSAGYIETLKICDPAPAQARSAAPGRISLVETIVALDRPACHFGLTHTTEFVSQTIPFRYESPSGLVDTDSAVICMPGNFSGCENTEEACQVRVTRLANAAQWLRLGDDEYRRAKMQVLQHQIEFLDARAPVVRGHVVDYDLFTPRTIYRFTGHLNGAVYGSPEKHRDGTTPIPNLFVSGTDQGFLGIVGAMMSGVSMANVHWLH